MDNRSDGSPGRQSQTKFVNNVVEKDFRQQRFPRFKQDSPAAVSQVIFANNAAAKDIHQQRGLKQYPPTTPPQAIFACNAASSTEGMQVSGGSVARDATPGALCNEGYGRRGDSVAMDACIGGTL